ncbi:hypothetical protein [Kitasatospora sp. MBT66]|uniref:hypothetical protein n=1 Tax=Kitasatospora sp. MBT66 TaxID=1444769 RepID=UPI000689A53E|nr:hypothetical protein [Kitasatospora sp. MBT66]
MTSRRPTTAPLTDTEQVHLDDLIRRGARHLTPAEAGRLLRLWEQYQADRAQERRSAGGAALDGPTETPATPPAAT